MLCNFGGRTFVPNIVGMQETDGSVTLKHRSKGDVIGHWSENGRSTCVERCLETVIDVFEHPARSQTGIQ